MDHTDRLNWLYERGWIVSGEWVTNEYGQLDGIRDWAVLSVKTLEPMTDRLATPEEAALKAWEKLKIQEDV